MKDDAPKLGRILEGGERRDAVHVAIIPMRAVRVMTPGEHLQNGVVDPFLKEPVRPGQRYWLFLFPGTVTGMRHQWISPAFPDDSDVPNEPEPAPKRRSEADVWMSQPVEESGGAE